LGKWKQVLGHEFDVIVGTDFPELFLPSLNSFNIQRMMPGLFFALRTGCARGKGGWLDTFAPGRKEATVADVAERLILDVASFRGFESAAGRAILADWLSDSLLQIKARTDQRGSRAPVIGLNPLHAFLYRVDLPTNYSHLRRVPEWVAMVLAQVEDGALSDGATTGPFGIRCGVEENLLLRAFSAGLEIPNPGQPDADVVDTTKVNDLDSLLAVRVAEAVAQVRTLPKLVKSEARAFESLIPATRARVRDAFSQFLRGYSHMPRGPLVESIFALLTLTLTRMFLSHAATTARLYETGTWREVLPKDVGIIVDVSEGRDTEMVAASRASFSRHLDVLRRYLRAHVGLRLLNRMAPRARVASLPDPANTRAYLEALSRLRLEMTSHVRLEVAVEDQIERILRASKEAADEDEQTRLEAALAGAGGPRFDRLVDAVIYGVQGENAWAAPRDFLRDCGAYNAPFGLIRGGERGRGGLNYRLSDALVEALVHRHVVDHKGRQRPLSLRDFAAELYDAYGLSVTADMPGGLAERNFGHLRRRLRELGLFRDVSDAERMQRLRPRYVPARAAQAGELRGQL